MPGYWRCSVWMIRVALLSLWMVFMLLGITLLGFTHLLGAGAIALELLQRPARRRPASARVAVA